VTAGVLGRGVAAVWAIVGRWDMRRNKSRSIRKVRRPGSLQQARRRNVSASSRRGVEVPSGAAMASALAVFPAHHIP
jgi:hypothetical protein